MSVAVRCGLYRAWRKPARTALPKRSGGRRARSFAGGRHPRSPAITPALLNASIQNGADIPKALTTIPPRAGPTARLTFTPALLSAIAGGRSALGTNRVTTACHGGAVIADPTLTMKV